MEFFDLVAQMRDVAVVADHVVGRREPLGARNLRREHRLGLRACRSVTRLQSRKLHFGLAIDDQHAIEAVAGAGFDEQRDRDDGIGPGRGVAAFIGEPRGSPDA